MTMRLISYVSGEVTIATSDGVLTRLPRERAYRLVMHARMHDVDEFVAALPGLVDDAATSAALAARFATLATSSERWAFKESFARLHTLARAAPAGDPAQITGSAEL